jgi:hypothetical protein
MRNFFFLLLYHAIQLRNLFFLIGLHFIKFYIFMPEKIPEVCQEGTYCFVFFLATHKPNNRQRLLLVLYQVLFNLYFSLYCCFFLFFLLFFIKLL